MKNRLIRTLVSCCKKRSSHVGGEKKNFLILSTTGLGDTLWATPALRALRETFPTSRIVVLTSPIGQEVLQNNRRVDAVFVAKKPFFLSFIRLYRALRREKITHVISFHTSQRMILPLAAILGASEVIGSYGLSKGLDDLLTHAVDHPPYQHEIQRRLDLVALVGAHTFDVSMEVFETPEEEKVASGLIKQVRTPSYLPIVVLHPGSKDRFKQWPLSHFIELGRRLVADVGCRLIITGGKGEKSLVQEMCARIPSAMPIMHLSVLELAALFKRVNLLVSNDTGPMHLAFSQKTPTIALFTPTDPRLCGPLSVSSAITFTRKPTCQFCLKKKCIEPFCLLQIGVDEVYEASLEVLYGKKEVR